VEARSIPDDVVEAVRYAPGDDGGPFAYGVQWHPEFIAPGETSLLDPQVLLAGYLEEVEKARREKAA
jgi:gamma-glutamyl-gamma-aminobutyrate hydrolase PuuD